MFNKTYLLFLLLLLISIKAISPFDIKIIPDAYHNATPALVLLDSLPNNTDFLYFSFDFNYHNQNPQKLKNEAYFKIETPLLLSLSDIRYIFLDKKQEELNSTDLDFPILNRIWKFAYLIGKEKNLYNEYNYYVQIHKFEEEKNTLILKLPATKKEGQISIENIISLPEEILEKKNKFKNFNNWPKNNPHFHNSNENHNNGIYKDNQIEEINPPYKGHHRYHYHYHYHHHWMIFQGILGIILLNVWFIIFILYCFVNKRKKSSLAVVIGNIQK